MIQRLRKKFIGICIISFVTVFSLLFGLIFLITTLQTNEKLDRHADIIAENDGRFPSFENSRPGADRPPVPNGFNPESPFTTRYFTVKFNKLGDILFADTKQVSGVNESEAEEYASIAVNRGSVRGWVGDYRYKIYDTDIGKSIVFVSGVSANEANRGFLLGSLSVFLSCSILIILLIVLISKWAVKPAAESYEKQKEFITNANHELKTPLTLIRTNLDILESDIGENEWLFDIREETVLMSELVNKMVSLARIDEENTKLEKAEFNLSEAVLDTALMFEDAIKKNGNTFITNVENIEKYVGDEGSVRQVLSILLDNALKYCDKGGAVSVKLTGGKHPILEVENDCEGVSELELSKLFDRFYRADKARTYGQGFGIGLSMAKALVEKSGGKISAHNVNNRKIKFKVKL